MSAAESSMPDAAEVLRVLRVVWRNAPASVYVAYTHISCSGLDQEGNCLYCGGGGCTTCGDPYRHLQQHVFTTFHGAHLTAAAATAQAREMMRRLHLRLDGKPELLNRVEPDLLFNTDFTDRWTRLRNPDRCGEEVWAQSIRDRENCRDVAATVYKTPLVGVTKQRAEALTR
jgi:hypothetical protein